MYDLYFIYGYSKDQGHRLYIIVYICNIIIIIHYTAELCYSYIAARAEQAQGFTLIIWR